MAAAIAEFLCAFSKELGKSAVGTDPVEAGLVASLNRPGGNLTGVAILGIEVAGKCLEVLRSHICWSTR
jgi:hypothetical protein